MSFALRYPLQPQSWDCFQVTPGLLRMQDLEGRTALVYCSSTEEISMNFMVYA